MTDTARASKSRRAGGRKARHALRAAAPSRDRRPIRPGLAGGQYTPLSGDDIAGIHAAALQVLDEIGLADAPQSGITAMKRVGVVLGDDGRLRFPAQVIETALPQTTRDLTLHGRDPDHDLILSGANVHYGTAGAAVHLVDGVTGAYRDSTLTDLRDAALLVQSLENVHFFQRPMVARDITDNRLLDLNTIYASASGTTKHIGTSFVEASHVHDAVPMLHCLAGSEVGWLTRPFVLQSNCFVVPPLKFATESCEAMEAAIKVGMPVLLLSAGQAGATAPVTLAGAVVQAVAECLAGLVYVHAISPGHPTVFGTWPFVSDLRTGAMSGGSGEQALLTGACAQMHHFYGLSGGAAAGIADSKLPDMQAGWEQAISNVMAGLSGLNMVYEAVGMHASLLGFCHESLILGDDMLGQALRCVRGIEVNDDTLGIEAMRATCLGGPGHYLGSAETLARMERDYVYPNLADRTSPGEWEQNGAPDLVQKAALRKADILSQARSQIPPDQDRWIRDRYDIVLP
ncbi:trimethylamine methyltransferase family protein [Actibacterium sp. 188UL27-1]|uniref:trimethylamine methyltransferase family protein n=1 Tax=Actibacterium sp. 188UL27-1 TaxID=2786961 RepID=UPI0019595974|nr:trimethylamine methyltransferase family protein [Actibacterium sp. 188UL27-1]MBM7068372.1 trimethylamine methyltransferase family protein [Actibacterium sp. 188UL27-1]